MLFAEGHPQLASWLVASTASSMEWSWMKCAHTLRPGCLITNSSRVKAQCRCGWWMTSRHASLGPETTTPASSSLHDSTLVLPVPFLFAGSVHSACRCPFVLPTTRGWPVSQCARLAGALFDEAWRIISLHCRHRIGLLAWIKNGWERVCEGGVNDSDLALIANNRLLSGK